LVCDRSAEAGQFKLQLVVSWTERGPVGGVS